MNIRRALEAQRGKRHVVLDEDLLGIRLRGEFRLSEVLPVVHIAVKLGSLGHNGQLSACPTDPPDFIFHSASGERWLIEETTLNDHFQIDGVAVPSQAITQPFIKLCNTLSDRIHLSRSLVISGSVAPDISLKELSESIRAYVASGNAREAWLTEDGRLKVRPLDEPRYKPRIHFFIGPAPELRRASNSRLDVQGIVECGLKELLRRKRAKLRQIRRGPNDRKVLAIWKGYIFAEPDTVSTALAQLGLTRNECDSVFLISGGEDVFEVLALSERLLKSNC
ncbi:MAG: hypothetical protein JO317_09315 [Verrucomicrobiae bacterium]|nr:hypothetical protein [Verrucomicrobiae bacterium]